MGVPGYAERFVLVVGKHRRQSVCARLRKMTTCAVRLVRVVEQTQSVQLRLAEASLAFEPIVVLARVRMEQLLLRLMARNRRTWPRTSPAFVFWSTFGPNSWMKSFALYGDALEHALASGHRSRIRHLNRIEHRAFCLRLQRIRAAVPEHSALRHHCRRCGRGSAHVTLLRPSHARHLTCEACGQIQARYPSPVSGPMLKFGWR